MLLLLSAVGTADVDTDVTADGPDGGAAVTPSKKRRRSGGPARAAREAAFLASKAHDATNDPRTYLGWPTFFFSD